MQEAMMQSVEGLLGELKMREGSRSTFGELLEGCVRASEQLVEPA
jgi:hypothetical protein